MKNDQFNKDKIIESWILASDDDYDTMMVMYNTKRYSWSLFIGHLVLEKLLKAYFVKINGKFPPFVHNLLRLAKDSKINISDDLLSPRLI